MTDTATAHHPETIAPDPVGRSVEHRGPPIESVAVSSYTIPTETRESDGTLEWDRTTLVLVEISAGGETGLGYTYGDRAIAQLIQDALIPVLQGRSAWNIEDAWNRMFGRLRNGGGQGASAMAISAVDVALWDLKAKLLALPLADVLGAVRDAVPVYGSGGFTSYTDAQLRAQFIGWASDGITRFKMKVGREPSRDAARVRFARNIVGSDAELFVDANSAYGRRDALSWAFRYVDEANVTWFEQPLLPSDLEGLRFLRERGPVRLEFADGEYGYDLDYFRRLIEAQAVDVVMADATRCGGITGFLKVATLCEAFAMPLSSHCAPMIHRHVGCAATPMRHAEWFFDHERIERMLFDGFAPALGGAMRPDLTRPGLGLEFKWSDAKRYESRG